MKTLKDIINEAVRDALNEAKSIKSKRLQDILTKHGGPGRMGERGHSNQTYDLHNMKDEDILCIVPFDQYRAMYDKKYSVDHGRWEDNYSLEVWAKNQGIKLEAGDRIGALELKDGNVLLFINRNEACLPDREGGWKDYYEKREKRKEDLRTDGARRYIPKHRRPFEYSQIWKNPYRKGWDKEDVDAKMDNIRQYYGKGEDRELNY